MTYSVSIGKGFADVPTIVVVGVGGTGSLVAEGLCRLLTKTDIPILFVDPDRVEPPNLGRQNFFAGDVGKFKSQALAERLSQQYGRKIGYSVMPYEEDMFDTPSGQGMIRKATNLLILGCVDNPVARRSIAKGMKWDKWWIDSGNGFNSGQVLIGNINSKDGMKEAFDSTEHLVRLLPCPSLQVPALLRPSRKKQPARDCAEAVEDDEQSPTINQAMAVLVLDMVNRLLRGTLTYMGIYVDMDAGTMHQVPAMPMVVSRMLSMKVDELMANKCGIGARYHV